MSELDEAGLWVDTCCHRCKVREMKDPIDVYSKDWLFVSGKGWLCPGCRTTLEAEAINKWEMEEEEEHSLFLDTEARHAEQLTDEELRGEYGDRPDLL